MSLNSLDLPSVLDTSSDDFVGDLFAPLLRSSVRYDRGVGYFSSGWLRENAQGMVDFAGNGGRARWITSPILGEEDWKHLKKGEAARRDAVLREVLAQNIADLAEALERDTLSALAWMVADGILCFKLALPHGKLDRGEFHDKFGIFEDASGERVSFNGSYNDSRQGLRNYESLKVFRSWNATAPFVESDIERFERLWRNGDPNVRVFDLPEAARADIVRLRSGNRPYPPPPGGAPDLPENDSGAEDESAANWKWRHQNEAIERFFEEERGVLEMATGTGKTRTALRISKRLIEEGTVDTVIVGTFGTDLLNQWYPDLRELVRRRSRLFRIYRHYGSHHEKMNFLLDVSEKVLLASRQNLPTVLRQLTPAQAQKTLLIHDEVHGLGSPSNREDLSGLSDNVRFRLGLSATPERAYDERGNVFIEQHIGPVIYEFGLDDAIQRGILCPFDYAPLDYELTEEDGRRLRAVYQQAAARKKKGNPMSEEEKWIKLANVRKTSEAKLPVFREYLATHPDVLERCIVFVKTKEYGNDVLDLVHEHHADFHTYYGGDDDRVLRSFVSGEIECLITCEKLSEGIDIPALKNVVLFSSSRAQLKTIQRIGRCLRTDPNDPAKVATVVDFVDPSPSGGEDGRQSTDMLRKDFLQRLSNVTPNETVPTHD